MDAKLSTAFTFILMKRYITVKPIANNFLAIGIKNAVFYFSYDVLIAVYYSHNKTLIASNAYYSTTSSKHLARIFELHRNDSVFNYTQDELNELNDEGKIL